MAETCACGRAADLERRLGPLMEAARHVLDHAQPVADTRGRCVEYVVREEDFHALAEALCSARWEG